MTQAQLISESSDANIVPFPIRCSKEQPPLILWDIGTAQEKTTFLTKYDKIVENYSVFNYLSFNKD